MIGQIYNKKFNAQRGAIRQGFSPDCVEAVQGGFVVTPPRQPDPPASSAPIIIRGKRARLLKMLRENWQPMPALMQQFGWQAHTLRAAMCRLATPGSVKIERRRIDGVTYYRAVQPS